jgi:homoaconitase/3-isopropylmalate dehydratase large subunit
MSIEAGARAGLIAPDDTTFQYMCGRHYAPKGAAWDAALARWRMLPTDDGAAYDKSIRIDASALEPMIASPLEARGSARLTAVWPNPLATLACPARLRIVRNSVLLVEAHPAWPVSSPLLRGLRTGSTSLLRETFTGEHYCGS